MGTTFIIVSCYDDFVKNVDVSKSKFKRIFSELLNFMYLPKIKKVLHYLNSLEW